MAGEDKIAIAAESAILIRSAGDISDALSASFGKRGLLLIETDLAPEFFDLRTGLAGEMFQKFVNYGIRVAIVLRDTAAYGERFSELAYEHSSHPLIRFVGSREDATAWLLSQKLLSQKPLS